MKEKSKIKRERAERLRQENLPPSLREYLDKISPDDLARVRGILPGHHNPKVCLCPDCIKAALNEQSA